MEQAFIPVAFDRAVRGLSSPEQFGRRDRPMIAHVQSITGSRTITATGNAA